MNIAQILKLSLGTAIHDFDTIAKKAGKSWEGQDGWRQPLTIWDKSGEMPADLFTVQYCPVTRGDKIKVIEALVQSADDKKCALKLSIEKFERDVQIGEPDDATWRESTTWTVGDSEKVVRGKIKCLLACAFLQSPLTTIRVPDALDAAGQLEVFVTDPRLAKIIDEIVKG